MITIGRCTIHHGDTRTVLADMPDTSVDAVVTDPPYGLEFMGKDWDSFAPKNGNAAATSVKAMSFRRPRFEAQETMGSSIGRVRFPRPARYY